MRGNFYQYRQLSLLKSAMDCYYKLRQLFYFKVRHGLLQISTGITKCDDYYKLRQYNLLQQFSDRCYKLRFIHPRRPRDGQWGREKSRDERFSSTGGKAPGYRLSPGHFQTVKRMLAPDWAQKMRCIIVPNRRTASPEFFS